MVDLTVETVAVDLEAMEEDLVSEVALEAG